MKMEAKAIFVLFFVWVATTGCSEENSDAASSLSSISGLMAATGAVQATGVTSEKLVSMKATTGVGLSSAAGLSWSNSESRGMCESLSLTKELFREAAQPDLIQCYIGAMVDAGLFDSGIYDGNYWLYELAGDPDMDVAKIKFKAGKAADGTVNNFEMFMCFGGTSGSPTQDGYINQTISGATASITSVHIGSYNSNSFGGRVSVSGAINASGWTSKTITATRSSTYGASGFSGTFGESVVLTQGASSLSIKGYRKGSWLQSGVYGDTFSDSYFAVAQILGASSLSTFALGDGSAKYNINWAGDTNGDGSDDVTYSPGELSKSWNGDTRANLGTASDGDYYSQVSGETLETVGSTPSVSFSGSETWDCSGSFKSANFTNGGSSLQSAMSACDSKYGFNDYDWIDCHSAE